MTPRLQAILGMFRTANRISSTPRDDHVTRADLRTSVDDYRGLLCMVTGVPEECIGPRGHDVRVGRSG